MTSRIVLLYFIPAVLDFSFHGSTSWGLILFDFVNILCFLNAKNIEMIYIYIYFVLDGVLLIMCASLCVGLGMGFFRALHHLK